MKNIAILTAVTAAGLALAGCSEKTQEAAEQTANAAADDAAKAAGEVGEAVGEGAQAVGTAASNAGDSVEDATKNAANKMDQEAAEAEGAAQGETAKEAQRD